MKTIFAALICILPGILLCSCAAKRDFTPVPALSLWTEFQRTYRFDDSGRGMVMDASLHYKGARQSLRATLNLWGNLPYPLRLNAAATLGANLAFIRQDGDGWLAVMPQQDKAYKHPDPAYGQAALGLPIPLTLREMALFATGSYAKLFPEHFSGFSKTDSGVAFHFDHGPVAMLHVDYSGKPTEMYMDSGRQHRVTLDKFEKTFKNRPGLATKITITGPREKAVLRIKSVEFKVRPWPGKALELEIPDTSEVVDLENLAP